MIIRPDGAPATQRQISMNAKQVRALMDVEPVLRQLGLALYCENCYNIGLKDGVQGDFNAERGLTVVECGCTRRVHYVS